MRWVAKTILTKAGHEVDHVVDGEQAFAAVCASAFDIVLMDISMPGMDGIEATHLIRKLPTAAARVPIVAHDSAFTVRAIRSAFSKQA